MSDLALDSTSIIELLVAIEDSLGVQFDPDNLTIDVFETFGTLVAYVDAVQARPLPTTRSRRRPELTMLWLRRPGRSRLAPARTPAAGRAGAVHDGLSSRSSAWNPTGNCSPGAAATPSST